MRPVVVTGASLVTPPAPGQDGLLVRRGLLREGLDLQASLSERIPRRMARRMTRLGAMVVCGADAALEDAGLGTREMQAGIASVLGTSYGEIAVACKLFEQGLEPGLSPTAFHNSVHNAPLGYLSIFSGLRGPSLTISDATLSGEESVCEAVSLLEEGAAEAVVAGSGDESCPSIFSPCWREGEDAPRQTARTIESDDRLVTDEGCGFLVLEDEESARARGATVRARLERIDRGGDLAEVLREASSGGEVDCVLIPAGLDREPDPGVASAVRDVLGPDVVVASEGAECGYVPASGVIRCVVALARLADGSRNVLVLGIDLDGQCASIRFSGGS
ncbi:MAG: beta-ketoacyl synthase chain length factor [Deltaproteobacteria bacterium]|nr:beta-ketoacyl synthase chain length factor [Deltaproteobacteria bacterium]